MNLYIDNLTEYLNDYYFQTLCLLYFPGEKFPPEGDNSNKSASFLLCSEGSGYYSHVALTVDGSIAEGDGRVTSEDFSVSVTDDQVATAAVGRAFLQAGGKLFGFTLPWGYLTGLRPVKRARYYLESGNDDKAVYRLFSENYSVSPQKSKLSILTAKKEMEMIAPIKSDYCALYIAIPFCPTRCDYCSFVSYSNKKLFALIPDYLKRLINDLKLTSQVIKNLGLKLCSIYIGGGTPSILEPEQLEELLKAVNDNFDLSSVIEFSFEAGRPDTVTDEKLRVAKSHGVNRISINPQTISDSVLEQIGRKHTVAQFYNAYEIALKHDFSSVNADLIAGLPTDTEAGFADSLNKMIELNFDNITVHTLSIKNAAPIRFDRGSMYDANGTIARNSAGYAFDRLSECGYSPYYLYRQKNTVGNAENTGYAKSGKEGLYNVLMMEEYSTVFACGASAITKLVSPGKDNIVRIAFPKYPFEYLATPPDIGENRIIQFFSNYR